MIHPNWKTINNHHLERTFTFKNFVDALAFTNQAGQIAEELDHHPEITLTWGKVIIKIWTHTVDGLTEKDTQYAERIDQL